MGTTLHSEATVGGAVSRRSRRRRFDLADSGPLFFGFLVLAAVAFWPSYLSRMGASSAYTHLHAFTATLWILLLVAQPNAIRQGNLAWHRTLGQVSYGLGPLIALSVILLAHSRISGLEGGAFVGQSHMLYLQIFLVTVFGFCYAMAIVTRRTTALHARFMVCTAFALIDPVLLRLMLWAEPVPAWNYQWLTFALTDLVILAVIRMDRGNKRGRWVFRVILPLFVVLQLPALVGVTDTAAWQFFAHWFAGLPLT
jgi:hypothetical protein